LATRLTEQVFARRSRERLMRVLGVDPGLTRCGLGIVDTLEDADDVQNVWSNFDIADEVLESVG
jgi:hypothetical protein